MRIETNNIKILDKNKKPIEKEKESKKEKKKNPVLDRLKKDFKIIKISLKKY